MIDYDRILSNLFIGTYPQSPADVRELQERLGITAVINLQTDEDLRQRGMDWPAMKTLYEKMNIEAHRIPMRDFDYDHQKERLPFAVNTLSGLIACGRIVYLHCSAGVCRSPLVAMAYLHWCLNMDFDESVKYVKTRRQCSPYEDLFLIRPKNLSECPEG